MSEFTSEFDLVEATGFEPATHRLTGRDPSNRRTARTEFYGWSAGRCTGRQRTGALRVPQPDQFPPRYSGAPEGLSLLHDAPSEPQALPEERLLS